MNKTPTEQLPDVAEAIKQMVRDTFPEIRFTDIWVKPGISWFGDEVMDIWAVYEGEVEDLHRNEGKRSFGTRVQDMLWDRGLDTLPKTHFTTKADAGDWRPEGI